MADDPNINIALKTTADTTGADETKQALSDVDKAAQDAQRTADVETAKRRQATRAAKEQAEAMRELVDGQQRLIAANLAGAIGNLAQQFGGLTPEVDMAVQSTQTFLTTLAATGNPIIALVALTGSAIGSLIQTQKQAAETIKEVDEKIAESARNLAQARAEWVRQVRTEGLEKFFQKETEALEDQEAALGRLIKIREAERNLANAQQQAGGAAAVRKGADPFAAEAANIAQDSFSQVAAINDGLAETKRQLDLARQQATNLEQEARHLAVSHGEGAQETVAVANQARDAARKAQQLADSIPDLERLAGLEIEKIKTETADKLSEVGEKAGNALGEKANEFVQNAQAKAAETGQELSQGFQTILSKISQLAVDGIDSKELPELIKQIQFTKATRESNDKDIIKGMESLLRSADTMRATLPGLMSRIQTLEADVKSLANRPQ